MQFHLKQLRYPLFLFYFIGTLFRRLLMQQAYHPPDVDHIFVLMEASPDLTEIFSEPKRRFYKRTSSAVWDRAPTTHKY